MYGMTNSGKIFSDDIINCLIYVAGFKKPKRQMYIYHKYAPYGYKLFVFAYDDDYVYWYTSE